MLICERPHSQIQILFSTWRRPGTIEQSHQKSVKKLIEKFSYGI
jgi:hypothetical protein